MLILALPLGEILVQAGRANPEEVNEALKLQHDGDDRRLGEILVEKGAAKPAAVQDALQVQAEARAPALSDSNIRVDVGLLDKLMNLVGELVLARNQILQFSSTQQDTSFLNTSQRLNLITTELQEGVMKTRMQPIGNIWSKFPRVVRDLATSCGKQVNIEMEGKETELDKTIIESIKDPLTHLVRNAVDHGVEMPEKRLAAGKSPEGHLFLRAFHEGGQVNIEISDDGAGIDLERVKQKALEKGLIAPDQAARLSDRELLNLLFLPGFSTAEKVTNVSGRGVGMDVVKTNIEKIGGTVDIQNRVGHGTTLKIKIPLTLAIIPALIVTSGGDRYAIPQVSLLELVRLEGEQARKGIEKIHGAAVYRLRGNLLPLVNLNHELCVEEREADRIRDPKWQQTMPSTLSFCRRMTGILAWSSMKSTTRKKSWSSPWASNSRAFPHSRERPSWEMVRWPSSWMSWGWPNGPTWFPRFATDRWGRRTQNRSPATTTGNRSCCCAGRMTDGWPCRSPLWRAWKSSPAPPWRKRKGGHVVQYRGQILPLIHLSSALTERRQEPRNSGPPEPGVEDEKIQVVVYTDQGRSVGLVVDRILDIAHEAVKIQKHSGRHGTLGSMVVQGRVTELLDLKGIIQTADPNFFNETVAA